MKSKTTLEALSSGCRLQERKVAVDALATVAAQFAAVAPDLRRLAESADGLPDCHAPDAFFQTLAAAGGRGQCMQAIYRFADSKPADRALVLCTSRWPL